MEQYIQKDALVAEIERRLTSYKDEIGKYSPFQHNLVYDIIGKKEECKDILSFIDTLEVKEVNVWKTVDNINPPQADRNKIYCVITKDEFV